MLAVEDVYETTHIETCNQQEGGFFTTTVVPLSANQGCVVFPDGLWYFPTSSLDSKQQK